MLKPIAFSNGSKPLLQNLKAYKTKTEIEMSAMNKIQQSHDTKKGLIYTRKLQSIDGEEKRQRMKLFSESNMKPLLLLDSGQLGRLIFHHKRQLEKKAKEDWLSNLEANRQIIQSINKIHGDSKKNVVYKLDKSNGFGHYMVFREKLAPLTEPGQSNLQKNAFFMTDIDEEQARIQKEKEEKRLKQLLQKQSRPKIPEDIEDYLQEKVKIRNATEEQ